jgi:hypothetical protein
MTLEDSTYHQRLRVLRGRDAERLRNLSVANDSRRKTWSSISMSIPSA